MQKYLQIINESKEKREAVIKYLKDNQISYESFDINNNEVLIKMGSSDRFTFEFAKEDFVKFLSTHNLKLSRF